MTRVLVAVADPARRTRIRSDVESEPALVVVGEAGNDRDLVSMSDGLSPDVCLLDLAIAGSADGAGAELIRRAAGGGDPGGRSCRVVALVASGPPRLVLEAVDAGAAGLLEVDAQQSTIAAAVVAAADGGWPVSPTIAAVVASRLRVLGATPPEEPDPPATLTGREQQVLDDVAIGLTNAEIAARLHLSLSTVKAHLATLMAKVGARNRVELAVWAHRSGRIGSPGRFGGA